MFKLFKLEDRIVLDGAAMMEAVDQAVDDAAEAGAEIIDAGLDAAGEQMSKLALAPVNEQLDAIVDTILNPAPSAETNLVLISTAVPGYEGLGAQVASDNPVIFYSEPSDLGGDPEAAGEIVIIDASVPGGRELAESVHPGAEVHVLESGRDGLSQISEILQGRSGVSALHLVTHGAPGRLQLGDGVLDGDALGSRGNELEAWRSALSADADILVYGCDVAAGADGEAFVAALAGVTGADVAASVDATGASDRGGDWSLERHTGEVETRLAFDAAVLAGYVHVLPITAATDIAGNSVWLDATDVDGDGDSDDQGDGQSVSTWVDKSGLGNDATADSVAATPVLDASAINGMSGVQFDGVNDFLSLKAYNEANNDVIGTDTHSVFVVWQTDQTSADGSRHYALTAVGGTGRDGRMYMGTDLDLDQSVRAGGSAGTTGFLASGVTAEAGTPLLHSLTLDNTLGTDELKAYINGNLVSSSGDQHIVNNTFNTVNVGAYRSGSQAQAFLGGQIGEILIYDHDLSGNDVSLRDGMNYTAGSGATLVDSELTLTEGDRFQVEAYLAAKWGIGQAALTITVDDAEAGDALDVDGAAILDGMQVEGRGTSTLTITGNATDVVDQLTVENLQALLRTMTFSASQTADASRTITVSWADGTSDTLTIAMADNEAPGVDLNGAAEGVDSNVAYTEGGEATALAPAAVVTDLDQGTLDSLTITITDRADGDLLSADTAATGIDAAYDAATGVLTLSGTASTADYQQVLRSVSFSSTSDAPGQSRSITVVGNDGIEDSTIASVSVSIQTVNSAPVLDDSVSPVLDTIDEDVDSGDNSGNTIAEIVVDGSITDVDGDAVEAIAIFAVDDANGRWEYSTDNGSSWARIDDGSLGSGHALLLDGSLGGALAQRVRFVPAADYNGTATFNYRAWDRSAGSAGTYADATSTGDTTPFSLLSDSASVSVVAVNDAPEAVVPDDLAVTRDTSSAIGGLSISDPESSQGDLEITLAVTQGTLTLAQIDGLTFVEGDGEADASLTVSGSVADINAALASLSYRPNDAFVGTDTLTLDVSDLANSGAGDILTDSAALVITVNDNTAPEMSTNTGATLVRGGRVTIGGDMLRFSDAEEGAASLVFTLSEAPVAGQLLLNGVALSEGDTFTQEQIDTGRVSYENGGSTASADNILFTVSDGLNSTEAMEFGFTVNSDLNIDANTGLTLNARQTVTLTSTMLRADAEGVGPDDVIYTLSSHPSQGTLRLSGGVLQAGDEFSQDDLDSGRLSYESRWNGDGAAVGDSFRFTVSDGAGGFIGQTVFSFRVNGTPRETYDDEPAPAPTAPAPTGSDSGDDTGGGATADAEPGVTPLTPSRPVVGAGAGALSDSAAVASLHSGASIGAGDTGVGSLFGERNVGDRQGTTSELSGVRSSSDSFAFDDPADRVPRTVPPAGIGDDAGDDGDSPFNFDTDAGGDLPDVAFRELDPLNPVQGRDGEEDQRFARARGDDELISLAAAGEFVAGGGSDDNARRGEEWLFTADAGAQQFDALGGGYLDALARQLEARDGEEGSVGEDIDTERGEEPGEVEEAFDEDAGVDVAQAESRDPDRSA
ncbi:MAG: DUF4347 domain-containing protein [Gammaproteobacteria bacterium]